MQIQSSHLRFATAPEAALRAELAQILGRSPRLTQVLSRLRDLDLPQWRLVSGALYNQVWNDLTGRPEMYGVKDIDVFYFDPDTSYGAEDRVIQRLAAAIPGTPPVEVRNQARVHLWYAQHFGRAYAPLTSVEEGIDRFASRTHMVGIRLLPDDTLDIYAPAGLRDIFAFRLTPNPVQDNRETHEAKAARQSALWPEIEVVPWPTADPAT
ncbi:MAG: nucleotidyltransferase family protein [Pseudomonadota bacterium]